MLNYDPRLEWTVTRFNLTKCLNINILSKDIIKRKILRIDLYKYLEIKIRDIVQNDLSINISKIRKQLSILLYGDNITGDEYKEALIFVYDNSPLLQAYLIYMFMVRDTEFNYIDSFCKPLCAELLSAILMIENDKYLSPIIYDNGYIYVLNIDNCGEWGKLIC